MSRSQIRRLVTKAVTRDSLYYRKLTDKVKEAVEEDKDEVKDAEKEKEETAPAVKEEVGEATVKTEQDTTVDIPEAELQEIAIGNSNFHEQLLASLEAVLNAEEVGEDGAPPSKKMKTEVQDESDIPQTNNGLVVHNGGVLDVPKLLEQMRRSEKSREGIEQLLVDLRRQNSELVKSNSRANEKIKDQSADIKSITRKLIDAEQSLRDTTKKSNEYFSTLSSVYDRVSVVIHRADPKRSSSITSSKRGSSRDRSNRKDKKSKERDAEPQKEATEKPKADDKKTDDPEVEIVVPSSDSKESVDSKKSDADKGDDAKVPAEKKDSKADDKKE